MEVHRGMLSLQRPHCGILIVEPDLILVAWISYAGRISKIHFLSQQVSLTQVWDGKCCCSLHIGWPLKKNTRKNTVHGKESLLISNPRHKTDSGCLKYMWYYSF